MTHSDNVWNKIEKRKKNSLTTKLFTHSGCDGAYLPIFYVYVYIISPVKFPFILLPVHK